MVSKLSDILPNPANPRMITESRFDSLSGSLDEFGDLSGVVYNSNPATMVAAHQLNRRCYGMEIDPKYCQVIVDRMLKLDPTLEIKRNGQVFTNFK